MKLPCFFGEVIAFVPKTSLFQEDPELQISATAFHQQRTSLDLKRQKNKDNFCQNPNSKKYWDSESCCCCCCCCCCGGCGGGGGGGGGGGSGGGGGGGGTFYCTCFVPGVNPSDLQTSMKRFRETRCSVFGCSTVYLKLR